MILSCVKHANTQIQIHKYKNRAYHKVPERPNMWYFLKGGLFKGFKNDIPLCQTHKYTNTNTQIQKYTNTAHDKVPERPNMWYIFEKRIVQGYQK